MALLGIHAYLRDSTLQHGDIGCAHHNVAEVKPYPLEVDTLCCCELLRCKDIAAKAIQKLGKRRNDPLSIRALNHLRHAGTEWAHLCHQCKQ